MASVLIVEDENSLRETLARYRDEVLAARPHHPPHAPPPNSTDVDLRALAAKVEAETR